MGTSITVIFEESTISPLTGEVSDSQQHNKANKVPLTREENRIRVEKYIWNRQSGRMNERAHNPCIYVRYKNLVGRNYTEKRTKRENEQTTIKALPGGLFCGPERTLDIQSRTLIASVM